MSRVLLEVFKDPLIRKLIYIEKVASELGVVTTYDRFKDLRDLITYLIGYNALFRFYLDLFAVLNLHFDFNLLEFWKIDFAKYFTVIFERISKGRYGMSKYEECIYDPEQATACHLEWWLWDMTYHTTKHTAPEYKQVGYSLKFMLETNKEILHRHEVKEEYVDAMEEAIAWAEGKVRTSAYWGFACWEVSPWKAPSSEKIHYTARTTADWKTEQKLETITIYECNWGHNRWDYGRWTSDEVKPKPELESKLADVVNEFFKRTEALWQGVFLLQRLDRTHHVGAYHQLRMGQLIIKAKALLCKHGVPVIQHNAYISALLELAYLYHDSSRHYKQWKKIMTYDDWLMKWERYGLDKDILRKLALLVGVTV